MSDPNGQTPTPGQDEQQPQVPLVADGYYTPAVDITMTYADGRVVQLAAKGVPILVSTAKAMGFIKDDESIGPTEFKEHVETEAEYAARIKAARKIDTSKRVTFTPAQKK